jgi:hypothetical protein
MRRLVWVLGISSLILLPACGDDDGGIGGADCSFSACGGDISGTWNITGICIEGENPIAELCPQATFDADLDASGTVSFESGGTFDVNIMTNGTISFTVPASCLEGTGITDCADLSGDSGTCSGSPSTSCTCTETQSETEMSMGTYTTSGNILTTTETGSAPEMAEYCVSGNSLKARFTEMESSGDITVIYNATR